MMARRDAGDEEWEAQPNYRVVGRAKNGWEVVVPKRPHEGLTKKWRRKGDPKGRAYVPDVERGKRRRRDMQADSCWECEHAWPVFAEALGVDPAKLANRCSRHRVPHELPPPGPSTPPGYGNIPELPPDDE